MSTGERYTSGAYQDQNPDWHVADSGWKCDQILRMLGDADSIRAVCEVGCGAGEILRQLHDRRPGIERLVGYEIAEAALQLARQRETERLSFRLGGPEPDARFDLLLIMDVIEHVQDPIAFLRDLRTVAPRALIHIPLDLSVQSVLRPRKLLSLRESVGHIHYYTLETALAVVGDAGWTVRDQMLTSTFELGRGAMAGLLRWPRRHLLAHQAARLLGGFSVLVDASC